MTKHLIQMTTTFTILIEVEADSREEAEEKVWEMYDNEEFDSLDTYDIDVNAHWAGYAEEDTDA
jgi:hypothetical protein